MNPTKLTYAIGDIHGRADLFEEMLGHIEADLADNPDPIRVGHQIVTLGDYIDRGPDSKRVLDMLRARPEIICLRGNHEDMLLKAHGGKMGHIMDFLRNGGDKTCESFGVESPGDIPEEYIHWILHQTHLYYQDALRVYVHAGVDHAYPIQMQSEYDLMWMREPFLSSQELYKKYVVHGHTLRHRGKPDVRVPEVLRNRCNLDTGAFATGMLTCAVFDSSGALPVRLIATGEPA